MSDFLGHFALPPLIGQFVLAMALAFIAGLGLEQHYAEEQRRHVFAPVRTFLLTALLGFILYHLPLAWAWQLGFAALGGFLLIYYREKAEEEQHGLTGSLSALTIYLLPAAVAVLPDWVAVLATVILVLVFQGQHQVQAVMRKLRPGELHSLARFLVLAGVILPLLPHTAFIPEIPLTPYGVWLAVVAFTAISYAGYLVQAYLLPQRGLMLVGALGGLYSSTSVAVSMARRLRLPGAPAGELAASALLATAAMYVRVLALCLLFDTGIAATLAAPLLALGLISAGLGWLLWRRDADGGKGVEPAPPTNPIELGPALLFALTMVLIAGLTQWVIGNWPQAGLHIMSLLVGLVDVDPYILSLLQHGLPVTPHQAATAILLAVASNNALKAVYAALFSRCRAGYKMAAGLLLLAALTAIYSQTGFL